MHHVGLKTILWGNFAASFHKNISVVNAISGLGVVFSDNKNILATILLKLVRISYYKNPPHSIFQNHDDRDLFLEHKIINNRNYSIINGSGVDLKEFSYMPEKISGVLNIVFTARMIKGKGVLDVIQAAEILRHKYLKKIKFILCGKVDENPNAIDEKYLNEVCDNDYIVYKGHTKEIKNVLGLSNLVILPSYYREGIPKSLIEATAIGRPIITTNSIGCKETVIDGFNGFLVPPKSPNEIAEKIKILINDHHLRKIMGKNSRIIAERKFSILEVEKRHLEIYNELING